MHGNSQVRIQIKKLFQQLIIKLRGNNIQIMHTAIHFSRLKTTRIAKIKSRRSDVIFHTFSRLRQFLKRKTERLHSILVKILMQDTQTFLSVKALSVCAQISQIFNHICFNADKFCPCLLKAFTLNSKNQIL